ncbi:LuxR C-terminal-related transcriptional regulator [Erythrobacter sp. sf7]|uniref:LuxR C-terminal-related transcriptional regulator n=1 Tax=Erythrobacter fulvus TaxID=2987523 RepID=A0ABT5JKH1_9SPHN|nr:LuxR C-terminal-related transcriptional regulator [Erythrobacter fulvus]MDC8753049.1 LuxR C-terminal-related transcriptional regulator [Erythrobacter fulvus]
MNKPEVLPDTDDLQSRVDRLTEKEKDCLRRWMHHQTAKQIALDLGVSHHAIEKRLKTARLKLDVASSIEAAQMLAQAEGYDWAAPHSPDLSDKVDGGQKPSSIQFRIGALIMTLSLFAAALIAFQPAPQGAEAPEAMSRVRTTSQLQGQSDDDDRKTLMLSSGEMKYKPASATEIREWLDFIFGTVDQDESGFIETAEAPSTFPIDDAMGRTVYTGVSAKAAFFEKYDGNSDGRVSKDEYIAVSFDTFKDRGIPILPEGLQPAG